MVGNVGNGKVLRYLTVVYSSVPVQTVDVDHNEALKKRDKQQRKSCGKLIEQLNDVFTSLGYHGEANKVGHRTYQSCVLSTNIETWSQGRNLINSLMWNFSLSAAILTF